MKITAINKLKKEGNFLETDKETEENEHSLEMHLPYIYKALSGFILFNFVCLELIK